MNKLLIFGCLLIAFTGKAQTDTISIVSFNVLNYPDGRDDCGTNTVVPNRADTLRKILSYAQPDIFVACEIQTEAGADSILSRALNVNGANNYQSAQFHANSTGGILQNQLYYNTNKLILYSQDYIVTGTRDIDHYVLYANDPNLGTFFDTTFIEVYMCHLKAGNGSTNQNIRAQQTQLLMNFIANRPTDHHHIVCGDLNVYSANEPGYQNLVSGSFGLEDPINMPGSWNNNGSFAAIHTQSTRTSLNLDCGSKGGCDDRFDQILVSSNVMNGADSIRYLNNSYRAIGNDGNHFNTNLFNGANTQYPDSIVRALFYMSDHLPVAMDMVITYPTSNGLALYPVVNAVSCSGASDGVATIVANQGQPPYTYQWDAAAGNATTATVSGLTSGQYCVQVTDNLGEIDNYCMFVAEPQPITYNTFLIPDTDNCNGTIHLLVEGGAPPYTYLWNDPLAQTTASATGLCGGNYQVTVTDANGCELVVDVSVQTVGFEELWAEEITVAPNPASDVLHISSNESISLLQIIDLSGRLVDAKVVAAPDVTWSVTRLLPGTYFLVIHSDTFPNHMARIRFVKE